MSGLADSHTIEFFRSALRCSGFPGWLPHDHVLGLKGPNVMNSFRKGSSAYTIILLTTLCGIAGSALAQDSHASRFGREGTVKVRVPSSAAAQAVASSGGTLVADYQSFAIVEMPKEKAANFSGEVLADENKILLNVGAIDTTRAPAPQARGEFTGRSLHLVQFAGPVQPDWLDRMTATGVEIVTYIPSNAYLVYGNSAQIASLQAVAAGRPEFQWNGRYEDEYKIDPAAGALMADPAVAVQLNGEASPLFAIQLVRDAATNAATAGVINAVRSGAVVRDEEFLNYRNVIAPIPPALLATVAAQPDVVSIQPYVMPIKMDERQDQIVAGNISGTTPTGPGYLTWLASRGFTQAQFAASNFAVDVSDSGIDNATTSPNHFGLYETGVRPGTSRIIYNRLVGSAHSGSTLKGCDGHGTLNTHIVLGFDDLAGTPYADASGYHYGLGVCPFTKAGSSVIFDPSTFTSPNYASLQSQAYNNGARISTNSWGANVSGAYNSDAQSYDSLVRDAQPTGSTVPVAGNQEMVIVFSAGNAGSGSGTIGSPGSAKNIICVGAAEGVQAFGGSDGCATPDSQANSANDMVSFSSRGPCTDGRKKPDIVAPGTHISGGVVQAANPAATGTADSCFTANGVCGGTGGSDFFPVSGQQLYTASSGTSHSCPAVAGGCALIRQFFINQGMTPPSPAMTKATLMNSARYLTGTGANDTLPSNSQGIGEMNLGEAFNRGAVTPTLFRDQVAGDMFTASGQTRVFTGTIADSSKPFRVTLAWTDAPGATSGAAYKNNLDLTVTIGANTYKGNVFSGANSVTGGSADVANNVESVFLPAGQSGAFTVTVTATNINSDGVPNVGGSLDQDFALVVYNRADPCVAAAIVTGPTDVHGCPGSNRQFSVLASGTPTVNYTWRRGTTVLTNGGHYSGVDTQTLTISSMSAGDVASDYNCVVSNSCGGQTSNNAAIIYCAADLDCNGVVDDSDFVAFATAYDIFICSDPTMPAGCPADLNGDTFVDDSDFVLFANAYDAYLCP